MKTWTNDDAPRVGGLLAFRQNGIPVIEGIDESGVPKPNALVGNWGAGNWSGSVDGKYRSLRAGLCQQDIAGRRFLVYAYFSNSTPAGMARVFQAYNCNYAIHLDMNALEHTYLALFRRNEQNLDVQHLIKGMHVLDSTQNGKVLPRFLGMADNRDFFYLVRRPQGQVDVP